MSLLQTIAIWLSSTLVLIGLASLIATWLMPSVLERPLLRWLITGRRMAPSRYNRTLISVWAITERPESALVPMWRAQNRREGIWRGSQTAPGRAPQPEIGGRVCAQVAAPEPTQALQPTVEDPRIARCPKPASLPGARLGCRATRCKAPRLQRML